MNGTEVAKRDLDLAVKRTQMNRAVLIEIDRIDSLLEEVAKKATAARKRLKDTGTANVVDSNVNGIGRDYEQMIQSIERLNTMRQIIDFVLADEGK